MQPSRRALVLTALGLLLALLPALASARLWPVFVVFWALVVLLLALDAVLVLRRKDIEHTLEVPRTLSIGSPASASLTLTAHTDALPEALVRIDVSEHLRAIPTLRVPLRREGATLSLPLDPLRRGQAELEAAWLRFQGPLGMIEKRIRIPLSETMSTVPNVGAVRGAALRFFGREARAGVKIEQFAGDGSEFDSLKEFGHGGESRAIDWKASARHGKVLERQFRAERNHSVVFAVDTGRLMAEPLLGIPRLDHAIHAALLLAYVSAHSGDRVSFYAFDERPRCYLEPRGGMAAFRAISQITADVEYGDAEVNYTLGLTNLLSRLRRRSLVIVLTDFVDTISAELMVENLYRVASRHLVVFVALRDPLLGELTLAEPQRILDLNRAVVADSLLHEREVVLARLRRRGIFCIDAPPRRVGTDLVNRYLDVKRRELI